MTRYADIELNFDTPEPPDMPRFAYKDFPNGKHDVFEFRPAQDDQGWYWDFHKHHGTDWTAADFAPGGRWGPLPHVHEMNDRPLDDGELGRLIQLIGKAPEQDWRPNESMPEDFFTMSRYAEDDFRDFFPREDPPLEYPQDDLGRHIDNETLDWAKQDHQVAGELRTIVTRPEQQAVLDQHIGDMGRDWQPAARSAPTVESVPDAQEAEPPSKPKLEWHSPEHFENSLVVAMTHGHDPVTSKEREGAARYVAKQLPPTVFERLSQNRVTEFHSHADSVEIGRQWHSLTGEQDDDIGGFYDSDTGHMAVNGADPQGTLAHEIGHALDSSGLGGYFQISTSDQFKAAWRKELSRGALSDYAATDECEGFAEVARLLYGVPGGREALAEQFPATYAVCRQFGMV